MSACWGFVAAGGGVGAPAARARTQPTSRQVGGRVRAVDDRESIDLARRPPCCHDEVHCLHYTDNQDYDDWFKGKVCKVNPPTSRTPYVTINIIFDDNTTWQREHVGSNNIIYAKEMPPGCSKHKQFQCASGRWCAACNVLREQAVAAAGEDAAVVRIAHNTGAWQVPVSPGCYMTIR